MSWRTEFCITVSHTTGYREAFEAKGFRDEDHAKAVYELLLARFPWSDGYIVTVADWTSLGKPVEWAPMGEAESIHLAELARLAMAAEEGGA